MGQRVTSLLQFLPGHELRVNPKGLLHLDVFDQRAGLCGNHGVHKTGPDKTAVAADDVRPVIENLPIWGASRLLNGS